MRPAGWAAGKCLGAGLTAVGESYILSNDSRGPAGGLLSGWVGPLARCSDTESLNPDLLSR